VPIKYVKGKGWKIENTPGYSETKEEARKRLAAIKIRQGRR